MLDEKRLEREQYIADAMKTLAQELGAVGVKARDHRPAQAHLFHLEQDARQEPGFQRGVRRARAARDRAGGRRTATRALGVVHNLWQPIPKEFDDYISRPKGNLYQSLHTAVIGPRGRTLEVQIRTEEMHRQAEYGVAAHWQYKEEGQSLASAFEQKVAWLRAAARLARRGRRSEARKARPQLDDSIYVLTPQGRVLDLPAGSTPIDFAYALAHRPRPPLPRRAGRRPHRQARHAARQRPARRDRGGEERRPLARLAEPGARLRPERARPPQDPPVVQRQGARRNRGGGARRGGEGAAPRGCNARQPGSAGDEARAWKSQTRCSPPSRATRSTSGSCRSR